MGATPYANKLERAAPLTKTAIRNSCPTLPAAAHWLGYAGLLPGAVAVGLAWLGGPWGWISQAAGFAYAALIFSFLGGVWWGQAIATPGAPRWVLVASVMPSLLGVLLFLPWTLGWSWPGPSLIWLGLLLALSPLVDRAIALGGGDWMTLRWRLSLGLGCLTIALGLIAMEPVAQA